MNEPGLKIPMLVGLNNCAFLLSLLQQQEARLELRWKTQAEWTRQGQQKRRQWCGGNKDVRGQRMSGAD